MILALLIAAALLTAWVPERGAVSLFQTGCVPHGCRVRHSPAIPSAPNPAGFPSRHAERGCCLVPLFNSRCIRPSTDGLPGTPSCFGPRTCWSSSWLPKPRALSESFAPRSTSSGTLHPRHAPNFTSAGNVFWLFPSGYHDFVLGPFVYRTYFAVFIELILPLALTGALLDRRRPLLYALFAGVLYASIVAAASRAALSSSRWRSSSSCCSPSRAS